MKVIDVGISPFMCLTKRLGEILNHTPPQNVDLLHILCHESIADASQETPKREQLHLAGLSVLIPHLVYTKKKSSSVPFNCWLIPCRSVPTSMPWPPTCGKLPPCLLWLALGLERLNPCCKPSRQKSLPSTESASGRTSGSLEMQSSGVLECS